MAMNRAPAEHVFLSVHVWLVRDRGRTILIDTGAGNNKARPYDPYFDHLHTPFLECLQTEGVAPEDVDLVLLTHRHASARC
jgi:glyoxylase-like metal-dependent hydrolase (beta-lactamase superfamily II)